MASELSPQMPEAPKENFSRGLLQADIPELGIPQRGKVRDSWLIDHNGIKSRFMVTTDRQSAYDSQICTVPGKGLVLNLLSAYWFDQTSDIIPNHKIEVPHQNVLIARQADTTLPVELVLRRYLAESSTTTSIFHNYEERGRRNIYGINFPNGLKANQELPMGTILTPTTKADRGHDVELTNDQALHVVDSILGDGTWNKAKEASFKLFDRISGICLERGLILADSKFEMGIINGELTLIDEIGTPDSSRFWKAESYEDKFKKGETPETFDKEILRRWLSEKGFRGEGPVPKVDEKIISAMASAYLIPYQMITGQNLPISRQSINEIASKYVKFEA